MNKKNIFVFFIALSCFPTVAQPTHNTTLYRFVHRCKRLLEQIFLKQHNFYCVDEKRGVYRSRQLTYKAFENYIQKCGLKTIINLKGEAPGEPWWENEQCVVEKYGINWVNIPLDGHKFQTVAQFSKLLKTFRDGPFPMLIHCEAGADRTGEAAALWVLLHNEKTPEKWRLLEALRQLAPKYKHFYFLHPKKSIFIKKFGATYLWLYNILKTFEKKVTDLTQEQIDALKKIAPEQQFFDHAVEALRI